MITIVGLGPGSIDDLSLKAWRTIENTQTLYLRTKYHPCVAHLPDQVTCIGFDDLYDSFDDVYSMIASRVVQATKEQGDVVYAVPGDPWIDEPAITRLLKMANDEGIEVNIINGISFIDSMCI